jgi:hypothetical protein
MRRALSIAVVSCALFVLAPNMVRAWSGILSCPVFMTCHWPNNTAGPFKIALVNFPLGSDFWWRLIDAINQHDGYPGSRLTVTYINDSSIQVGDTISLTDDQSNIIFSQIDSVGGTTCVYDRNLHMTGCERCIPAAATRSRCRSLITTRITPTTPVTTAITSSPRTTISIRAAMRRTRSSPIQRPAARRPARAIRSP